MPSTVLYLNSSGEPLEFANSVDASEALASGHYAKQPSADVSPVRTAPHAAPETPAGRLQAVQARMRTTQARILTLREQALTDDMLSDAEATEILLLQSQVPLMASVVARLDTEVRSAQYVVDVARVQDAWTALARDKEAAHEAVVATMQQLKAALEALAVVHRQQEACLTALPHGVLARLNFPGFADLLHNMASRMPDPRGWDAILNNVGGFVVPRIAPLLDIDPGTKPLPQRLLNDYKKD